MKKIKNLALLIIFLSFSSSAFAGVYLVCKPEKINSRPILIDGNFSSFQFVAFGTSESVCKDSKGREYSLEIYGFGPGLELSDAAMIVACPNVSKRRLLRDGEITFGAVMAKASIGVGATAGLSMNNHGGLCVISGLQVGIGASLNIGGLTISTLKKQQ